MRCPARPSHSAGDRRGGGDSSTLSAVFDDALRVAPDQLVGALGEGDRPLGVVPQGQAGHAEHGGLLLHPAGVGQHQPGRRLQRDEVEVAGGRDDLHPRPGSRALRSWPAARGWAGSTSGQLPGELAQRRQQRGQRPGVVHVRRPVQGHQAVPARLAARAGPARPDPRARSRLASSVSTMTLPTRWIWSSRYPSARRLATASGGRGEQVVAHPVGDDPVDLLGHASSRGCAARPRRARAGRRTSR